MDPDPAFFVIDLQEIKMPTKNNFCINIFSAYYCLKVHLHNFPKIKSQKWSQNSRNQGFSYYFCMITEESGSKLTNGSGSGRPKNMWIRWITDPDSDPEHWFQVRLKIINFCQNILIISRHLVPLKVDGNEK